MIICGIYFIKEKEIRKKKKNPKVIHLIMILENVFETSLVAQWLRICLPVQGTWVRALVWEDPTCRGAHNY